MNTLLLQNKTSQSIKAALDSKSHAVILVGPEGSGKAIVAKELLCRLLGLKDTAALNKYSFYLQIESRDTTIGIDQIRELVHFLSLKTAGREPLRRGILVKDGHMMTQEAQNSLLKSLEEPPADTIIILTTASLLSLLPTIRSRAQIIDILPIGEHQAVEYFAALGFDETEIKKAYAISRGYVGLMSALLHMQGEHNLLQYIEQAKQLLVMPVFERLKTVDELSKRKEELPLLFHSLRLVCKAAITRSNSNQAAKLVASLRALEEAQDAYTHSANNKLLLTYLFLHI